jgi:hypothetical protein
MMHVQVHAAFSNPCCMFKSMLHVQIHATCSNLNCMFISILHPSILHVHANSAFSSPCCISASVLSGCSILRDHFYAAYSCLYCKSMSMLSAHDHAACPCQMLHDQVHAACPCQCCMFKSMFACPSPCSMDMGMQHGYGRAVWAWTCMQLEMNSDMQHVLYLSILHALDHAACPSTCLCCFSMSIMHVQVKAVQAWTCSRDKDKQLVLEHAA